MFSFFNGKFKELNLRGLTKNPLFYFGLVAMLLLWFLIANCGSLAKFNYYQSQDLAFFNPFFKENNALANSDLFFSQSDELPLETPDLKIIQNGFIYGITTPRVLTTQTLGDIFGGDAQNKKDVVNYVVQLGDTPESVAQSFNISVNTLLWANDLTKNSTLQVGQTLTILPVSGLTHVVKSGDTIGDIAKKYKAKSDDIIAFNNLAGEGDIFIGDILIIPNGTMPSKLVVPGGNLIPLPNNFFVFPTEGVITQGLHYYNAIDIANKCGTPVYAAAAGTVQRAVSNNQWNFGMGNHITILHTNGVSTYYGHLMILFVKPGDIVNTGDRIGLMGRTGNATGCHVHFEVIGASNFMARYPLGAAVKYSQ